MQTILKIPDSYPKKKAIEKVKNLEENLEKEIKTLQFSEGFQEDLSNDPWVSLKDIDEIAVDTGKTDGSVNYKHYLYGSPKKI